MRFGQTIRRRPWLMPAVVTVFVALGNLSPPVATADISSNTDVSAIVDQSFSFGVVGKNSGSCNGATITGTGSTGTAISLGRVDKTSSAVGGQQLNVSSNAGGGFIVYAHVDGALRDNDGHSISNLGHSPNSPGPFASPGTEAFGYTTDSVLPGGSTRFLGNNWAAIDTNDREVMHNPTTVDGASNCLAYQITISSNTVGGFYGNNVVYTAVPTF